MANKRIVKVAVVGSGLAGLTAAYRLAKTPTMDDVEFEVHLFEKVCYNILRAKKRAHSFEYWCRHLHSGWIHIPFRLTYPAKASEGLMSLCAHSKEVCSSIQI